MKIRELIKQLSMFDPETLVFTQDEDADFCSDVISVESFNDQPDKVLICTKTVDPYDERFDSAD